jgi:periplasmic protein TonB
MNRSVSWPSPWKGRVAPIRRGEQTGGGSVQSQHILFVGETERAAKKSGHIILPPPKVEPLHEVFAEAMLEDTSAHRRRSPLDWVVSLAVHIALLSALLILPLYYTAGLDFQKFNMTFLAPPVSPAAAPPPPPASSAAPRTARNASVRTYVPGKLTLPMFIPKTVVNMSGEATPPDEALMGAIGGVPGGVSGGIPGGQVGGVIGGILGGVLKGAPPPALAVAAGPKAPVLVGGNVKPPRLLFGPEPEYPILAKQSRLSGVVVIEAVIDEQGKVTGMRVLSGHPLLIPAALAAVSKRKYEPTVLDGEPTSIKLRIEVGFNVS